MFVLLFIYMWQNCYFEKLACVSSALSLLTVYYLEVFVYFVLHLFLQQTYAYCLLPISSSRISITDEGSLCRTRLLTCSSVNNQYRQCYVKGNIRRAVLKQELSLNRCKYRKTYGWSKSYVWVSYGCRAKFAVTVCYWKH